MAEENDAVGYGKPPKHTRFRKGQSGNPKGRPKKNHTNMNELIMKENELIMKEMSTSVTIREGGVKQRQLRKDKLSQRLWSMAL
jgi:hypothetical protein